MQINWTVAVYETNKAYGGPEEGGWWYEYGYLQPQYGIHGFETEEEALSHLKSLKQDVALWNKEDGRREPGSVLCDGWLEAQLWEGLPPQSYPDKTPRYE